MRNRGVKAHHLRFLPAAPLAARPWAIRPIRKRASPSAQRVQIPSAPPPHRLSQRSHPPNPYSQPAVIPRLYFPPGARQPAPTVKRILVIDDEAKLRRQFADLLAAEGFTVIEARNGREGVDLARREQPDLVMCDITMPEMNGHRVLETLRQEPATAHLPFIFLTGWSEKGDIRTGMNLGADDYLTKPVEPDDLIAAVHARLRRVAAAPRRANVAEASSESLESLGLTPREAEILLWVSRGKTNPEIATILGIGLTTVKKHLESTFAKLGVENRTAAAALALETLG